MPKYTYKAQLIATGEEVTGVGEAASKLELAKNMKAEDKLLLTATEITKGSFNMDRLNALLSRVSLREKILFARNLGTMIEAGLALSRALHVFLKQTKNPKFRQEYEKLEPEFAIARTIIEARIKDKVSQEQLAKKMGTGQAVISRLEGASSSPSLSLIKRLASALNLKVELRFTPK